MTMLKNFLKITTVLTMLAYTLYGCASLASYNYIVPPLKDRTLRLAMDKPSFIYHYKTPYKCGAFKLFTCWEDKTDEYDLTKPEVRKSLIEIGFIAKRRDS